MKDNFSSFKKLSLKISYAIILKLVLIVASQSFKTHILVGKFKNQTNT